MQTSTNGGSTFDSGASNYAFSIDGSNHFGSQTASGSGGDTQILLSIINLGAGTGEKYNGRLTLFRPSDAGQAHIEFSYTVKDKDGTQGHGQGGAVRLASANVDAFRLYMSGGNINGVFHFYGVRKS